MGEVVLCLSPHLDDAVLSCPGYIQRLVKDGTEVQVATVFTAASADGEPLYRLRRAEDRSAVGALGASALHLGLLDAPFRSPKCGDFAGIVFGRAREYPATRRLVAQAISEWISRFDPIVVVSPLAVGNHVDHRLVRDAALLAVKPERLLFYEDRPYAFIREQVGHVLGKSLARMPEEFWRRYFAATYVRRYRGTLSDGRIVRAWSGVPPFPAAYRLRKVLQVELRPAELARALAAISTYQTQMPDLFTGERERKALYGSVPETIYRAERAAG